MYKYPKVGTRLRQQLCSIGTLVTHSAETSVTPGASNVKGSWTELVASTSDKVEWVDFRSNNIDVPTNLGTLVDIGIGPAGSEQVIVPNISCGQTRINYWLPIHIPKGSRVALRAQSSAAAPGASTYALGLYRGVGRRSNPRFLVDVGTNTASSRGQTAGTDNTYVQIIAATTQPFLAVIPLIALMDGSAAGQTGELADFAVGAAASEVIIYSMGAVSGNSEIYDCRVSTYPITGHFPSGLRFAGKSNFATGNNITFSFLGVPYL